MSIRSCFRPRGRRKFTLDSRRRPSTSGGSILARSVRPLVQQLEARCLLSVSHPAGRAPHPAGNPPGALGQINHIVVIYQENWSFDALYGKFPGANGIANASQTSLTQVDRTTGQPIAGQTTYNPVSKYKNGASATLQNPPPPLISTSTGAVDTRFLTDPTNPGSPAAVNTLKPYDFSPFVPASGNTGDIVHRYWQEQSQIHGGKQDQYVTWSDNPGLVMSNIDATNLPEGLLAQQYTMDDNFFHASFGGSFLNHQWLVSAASPVYPNAPASLQPTLDSTGQLALDADGKIVHDGNITPIGSPTAADPTKTFDKNYAVNTIFSTNLAPDFVGNNTATTLLPSQNDSNPADPNRPYIPTIGDRLDGAGVNWKWYSGGWDAALASSPSNPANNGATPANDTADPNFQWHHQPLAYYDNFAPWLPNGQRNPLSAAHLQDENNFFSDLSHGSLPAVSFIKPIGANNEHPGYASLLQGQQHVADIVHAVQNSPDWAHTAIVITYDENGGRWDHVSAPDNNGIWGDGTRVPAIVISPFAKKGFVDHTEHDTLSILKTIEERFNLQPLSQYDAQASDLSADFQKTAGPNSPRAYLQPDYDNMGKNTLVVQGGGNETLIKVTSAGSAVRVQAFSGTTALYDKYFDLASISRLEVYGQNQTSRTQIFVSNSIKLPALLFGGAGGATLYGGGGPAVVVGGAGSDTLIGGAAPAILIGGGGNDTLIANFAGNDLLVAGKTTFDDNIPALKGLIAEWASADTYAQRVARLSGGATGGANGGYLLDTSTVQHDAASDVLIGQASGGLNWYFAHPEKPNKDLVFGRKPGEFLTFD